MCKQCEIKPVYEFTNQRKLCKNCFIRYFQKKVLFIIRKFGMIKKGDTQGYPKGHKGHENLWRGIIGYYKSNYFRGVVLEDVLKFVGEKCFVEIKKLPRTKDTMSHIARKLKLNAIAWPTTIDLASQEIVNEMINGDVGDLMEGVSPIEVLGKKSKIIKPLYLFLDREVLLYAKLRGLKFKRINVPPNQVGLREGVSQGGTRTSLRPSMRGEINIKGKDKIGKFINELEKKHPEVKRAVVNGYLAVL